MKLKIVLFLGIACLCACSQPQNRVASAATNESETAGHKKDRDITAAPATASGCDEKKWKSVYDPDRLEVLDKCKTVTGVITERNPDPDGDEHMLLKLDKDSDKLLRKKNFTKKEGCLVIEAVCINNITRKRAKGACDGYVNDVMLPKVGDHVTVTGSYVVDSHNGWTEIHPISKVELIH